MPDHEGETREGTRLRAVADDDREEAELAHRAEGEDALQVGLPQCLDATEQHREHAERDDDRPPGTGEREDRRESCDQVDAGLHHRGCVQVGAHGRGRGHRTGQPEVEREDRGLADGADEEHHDGRIDDGARRGELEDLADARGAGVDHQQHDTDEHHETAEGGDQERLESSSSAGGTATVVADEEVREDARHLPEHDQHDQVVGQYESVHRARESEQDGGELPDSCGVVMEVPPAVQQHEGTDARDDQREHPAEDVHVHGQVQPELRDPLDRDERCRPVEHLRGEDQGVDECRGGNESGDGECLRPQPSHQHGHQDGPEKEHGEERQHIRGSSKLVGRGMGTGGRVSESSLP